VRPYKVNHTASEVSTFTSIRRIKTTVSRRRGPQHNWCVLATGATPRA